MQDRKYFRSVYFRMPDGILVEIATDGPGSSSTSRAETLGQALSLPPWLEPERATLERELDPDRTGRRGYNARALRRWWRNW